MAFHDSCLFTLIIAVSRVLAGDDAFSEEELKPCIEMFNKENLKNECCKGMDKFFENSEECPQYKDDWTCEDSKCLVSNEDIEEGGKLSDKKAIEFLERREKRMPQLKEWTAVIKKLCLNGAYEYYGNDETCPTTKLIVCIYFHTVMSCPEWKDDDICKKMSENAEKCKQVLDKIN